MRLIEKFQRVNSAFFNINRLCSIIKKIPLLCLYLLYDIAANQLWNINTACFIGAIFTIRLTDYRTFDVTGFTQRSGYCEYPLYMFNVDKLRELCPDGMEMYEANIGMERKLETKELAR